MNKMAFPSIVDDGETMSWDRGMTLRDYFASKAMQGWLLVPNVANELDGDFEGVATWSYHMADAMMKAREK